MLVIRLARTGRKNSSTFRVVLQEHTQTPKAKSLEVLGSYHPHLKDRSTQVQLDTERIAYWLSKGAQPSDTVHNLLIEFGVITGQKRRSVKAKKVEETVEPAAEATADQPATDADNTEAAEKAS